MTDGKVTDSGVSVQTILRELEQATLEVEEAANVMELHFPAFARVLKSAARAHRGVLAAATGQ